MTIAQPKPNTSGFTAAQLDAYYTRINLPSQHRHTLETAAKTLHTNSTAALTFLSALQLHQICAIPFENLSLHYSHNLSISTSATDVYHKLVERKRGGYCMENTTLLYHILLTLGFTVYATGGRVLKAVQPISSEQEYIGEHWNHMVLILTLSSPSSEKYILDAGFSNMSPIAPIPLLHNAEIRNSGFSRVRLVREGQMWRYQVKYSDLGAWISAYEFSTLPFTAADFVMMSYFTSKSEDSWFTKEVVVARMERDEEGRCVGDVTLFGGKLKRRVDGKSEVIAVCETERERVEVLEREFGVVLDRSEREGIVGADLSPSEPASSERSY
ncbi:cysteine proteinase [Aureobasidium pullulans]|nr:cysteine proteinase [Aureobasidium pullulans]